MENNQQDTDARILVRYIASCADPHNPVPPLQVLQVAIHLLDEFREHPEHVLSAWDFIDKAQQILQNQNPSQQYYRRTPGYQVVAAMYIMLKVDGLKTIEEEALANDIFQVLDERSRKNFHFDQQAVEQAIKDIQQYKKTAPPTINPLELFAEIADGKNLAQVDWKVALNEVVKYQHLFGKTFPYYLLLHTFVQGIKYPIKRIDVLGYLQTAAEKYLPEPEAKEFVDDAHYLNSIYLRLNGLLSNGLPKVWDNAPDMDELTLFVRYIEPTSLVAIAQSIYDSREIVGQRIGMVQHILRHEKYSGQLLTTNSYDFCKCLYLAHGYRMLMMSGKEDFRELPTIDNLDCELRNACFDVYIDLRVKQILQELKRDNRRLYPAKVEEAYDELIKQLTNEYTQMEQAAPMIIPNFMARDSLLTAMNFLAQYAQGKQKSAQETSQPKETDKVPVININAPVGQFIANVEQLNTTKE